MQNLEKLLDTVPDAAKDVGVNMTSVLGGETLTRDQAWGVALASACFVRHAALVEALLADARAAGVSEKMFEDARAAAAIMGMNTIYYRFRHLVGIETYGKRPARLRMQRMATPQTSKVDFELLAMACAVLAGCESCIKAHEASIRKEGLGEEHVHDAVRIAAVVQGTAIALDLPK